MLRSTIILEQKRKVRRTARIVDVSESCTFGDESESDQMLLSTTYLKKEAIFFHERNHAPFFLFAKWTKITSQAPRGVADDNSEKYVQTMYCSVLRIE